MFEVQKGKEETAQKGNPRSLVRPSFEGKKIFLGILILALVLFPLLQFTVGGLNYWLHMLLYIFMYIAITSSWNIIGGYTGYTSLGHNVFFGVGGYVSGMLLVYAGVSPFLTAPIAGLVAMALGLLVGLISMRTRGPSFVIATIAMLMTVKLLFDNWGFIGGVNGLSLPMMLLPLELSKMPFYYGMLLIAMGAVYTSYRVRHSKFGLGLRAISQDETKAQVVGINPFLYKVLAFAISGLFVGMAGALWGYYMTYLRPVVFLSVLIAAQIVLMSILGGRGTVAGPVVGAIIFIIIKELFVIGLGSTELNIVGTGILMIIVLLFFPRGIVGTLKEIGKLPKILDWG